MRRLEWVLGLQEEEEKKTRGNEDWPCVGVWSEVCAVEEEEDGEKKQGRKKKSIGLCQLGGEVEKKKVEQGTTSWE